MGDELLGTGMNGHQHYMDATGYSYPNPQPFTGYYEHPPFQYINVGPTIHQTHQESEYWSMQMNSYKYGISGQYATSSYYGVYGNVDHGPRDNWDYAEVANVGGSAAAVDLSAEQGVVSEMQYVPEEGSIDEEDDAVNTQVLLEDDVDPDTMSYEELLDLGEAVGAQSRGLSQELIDRLPTSKHKSGGIFSRKKSEERCVICQMRYKRGDRQINLPCKHAYHTECGSKWLSINKTCPVCNTEVFADE